MEDIKSHLYSINAYIMTFFKTIETYTKIEDKELKCINDSDKNILYNVTHKGLNYIYNNMIQYVSDDYNKQSDDSSEKEYEKICDKVKQIILDYCEELLNEEV